MDEKFSKLAVIVDRYNDKPKHMTVTETASCPIADLFFPADHAKQANEFDIAYARSLVSPRANVIRIMAGDKVLFVATKDVKRKDQYWTLEYHPTDKIALDGSQDKPAEVTHGKPENSYASEEVRKYAVNTLKLGLRAFGIYIPRESIESEPVKLPDNIQALIDAIPADTPNRDQAVAELLKLATVGIKSIARSEKVKANRKNKANNPA